MIPVGLSCPEPENGGRGGLNLSGLLILLLILSVLGGGLWYGFGPPAKERFKAHVMLDSELSFVAESPNMAVRTFGATVLCQQGKVSSMAYMVNRFGSRRENSRAPEGSEYLEAFGRAVGIKPWEATGRGAFRSMQYTFQYKIRYGKNEHIFNSVGSEDPRQDELITIIKRLSGFGILEKQ